MLFYVFLALLRTVSLYDRARAGVRLCVSVQMAGRYSSVGSDVAWESRGTAIDPRVQHIFSLRFGHEIISTAILPLPLIQEE